MGKSLFPQVLIDAFLLGGSLFETAIYIQMFDTFMMGAPGGIFCAFAITDYELSSIKKPRKVRQKPSGRGHQESFKFAQG